MQKIEGKGTISFINYLGDFEGCGYLRIIYPSILLNQYKYKDFRFNSFYLSTFVADAKFYSNATVVQFQRSATTQQMDLIRFFKEAIAPKSHSALFYEIDDLLFDIKEWNYAHEFYKDKREIITKIMSMCNGVCVSTEKLKEIYSPYNKNISINKNRLPKFIWGEPEFKEMPGKPRILWAGSANHFSVKPLVNKGIIGGDFGDELMNFIKKTTDIYQWVFVGGFPIELEEVKSQIEYHKWVSINQYPRFIKSLNASIGIAPLENSVFNRSKSNVKALEYTAAGIPGVYTNIDPYKDMSIVCDYEEEMIDSIEKLASDKSMRYNVWKNDYDFLKNEMFWEDNDNLLKYVNNYLNPLGKYIGD